MEYGSPEQRAHHEAGHAVAAWAVHGVNVIRVHLPDEGGGVCTLDQMAPNPLGEILISMAAGEVDNVTVGGWAFLEVGSFLDIKRQHEAMRGMGIDTENPMDPKYCAAVERAARVAHRFVERHFTLIQKVAAALLERRTLAGEDLRALLPAELENTLYAPQARPQRHDPRQVEMFSKE